MLSCQNLSIERGGRALFSQLGFTAGAGACIEIRGANGLGKTTLLHALTGLKEVADGQISWHGEPIDDLAEIYKKELWFVGHEHGVKLQLSVYENLAFWAKLSGTMETIESALHFFGLDAVRDIKCSMLSKGWQKRVALARLMVVPKPLWILDEPLNHLDEQAIATLASIIAVRCDQGGIVIMSNHQNPLPFSTKLELEDFRISN